MAERVVSPGVFTRERDLTFLEQGVANIGGAFVGVTQKGPAFVPVIVNSQTEFEERFGKADEYSYLGYTVQNYLQEAQSATVVRVLGKGGYQKTVAKTAALVVSDANVSDSERVLAVFHPTISGSAITAASVTLGSGAAKFTDMTIALTTSNGVETWTGVNASGSSANSIANSIGTNPYSTKGAYVYSYFPDATDGLNGGIAEADTKASPANSSAQLDFTGVDYSNASTPWIRSQAIGGTRTNLFKVHTLADGTNANTAVKISFQSIKYRVKDGEYGTFSLLVRQVEDDTDANPIILEEYQQLTLDPNSSDYIARRIGNSAPYLDTVTNETYYQGDYPNRSRHIRIELSEDTLNGNLSELSLPYGFAGVSAPYLVASFGAHATVKPRVIQTAWSDGNALGAPTSKVGWSATQQRDAKLFYGYDYTATNNTNQSYLAPLPTGHTAVSYVPLPGAGAAAAGVATATVAEFSLDNIADGGSITVKEVAPTTVGGDGTDLDITNSAHVAYRKFTVPMQGGFDGHEPHREKKIGSAIVAGNTQGFDLTNSAASGSVGFKQAIDAIKNPESFDINLLVIPGVNYEQHPYICQYAIDVCEERQDCFYIMDLAKYTATISEAITTGALLDTNYAAGWYPWVKVLNSNTNRFLWAPPSVVLPEVFASNDNSAAEWYAPAGLNRGGIDAATQVKSRLTRANRDELYENKINPIATFPGQGIVAWGQKTLQKKASALDRINVRRLLIALKKFVASSSRYLVFEQNTEATRNRFLNIVNPYLASVQERQGLYAFRVVMDETNNTPDVIDRNQLVGQIYLQPARAAEFIVLDFNILPTGATFPGS